MLRVRDTLFFEDVNGTELCKIQQRLLTIRDAMTVEGPNGETMATVKKALITPLRDRWTVKVGNGPDLQVQGNILDHQYTIGDGSSKVAEVSKRWFRLADTYGVLIEPSQNDIVILAASSRRRAHRVLEFHRMRGADVPLGGLLLTCGRTDEVAAEIREHIAEVGLPTLLVKDDTATAERKVLDIYENTKLQTWDTRKMREIVDLFARWFDMEKFLETFEIGR